MGDLAIKAEGLGKMFNLNMRPNLTLKDTMDRRLRRFKRGLELAARDLRAGKWPVIDWGDRRDFWALRDVSFELRYGEVLGIIGDNGAGKSTLLKILSQVIAPTEGRAELHGNVGALLEVGTGFNPELSGRENIYLYGSIMGMDRDAISRRFDDIVGFSGVEKFLEEPLKHYSNGMHARLGFSVAAHLECDILLVDEVLSVGDAAFSIKCLDKMREVTRQGRAVIFVSHGLSSVNNMCDTAIVLGRGRVTFNGLVDEAITFYMDAVRKQLAKRQSNPASFALDETKPIQFKTISMRDERGELESVFQREQKVIIEYEVIVREPSADYFASLVLRDEKNNGLIHTTDADHGGMRLRAARPGEYILRISLPDRLFKMGRHFITPSLELRAGRPLEKHENLMGFMVRDLSTSGAMLGVKHRNDLITPDIDWELLERPSVDARQDEKIVA